MRTKEQNTRENSDAEGNIEGYRAKKTFFPTKFKSTVGKKSHG